MFNKVHKSCLLPTSGLFGRLEGRIVRQRAHRGAQTCGGGRGGGGALTTAGGSAATPMLGRAVDQVVTQGGVGGGGGRGRTLSVLELGSSVTSEEHGDMETWSGNSKHTNDEKDFLIVL